MTAYQYKKPSSFNLVSLSLLLLLVGAFYGAFKYGPVYYTRFQVDQVLEDMGNRSADLAQMSETDRVNTGIRVLELAQEKIRALGVGDTGLNVYYSPELDTIHADYEVAVSFPGGKSHLLRFRRVGRVPTGK